MVFVLRKKGKISGNENGKVTVGSWVIGYWVPKEHFEINVWNCFENRYKRVLKAKKEQWELKYEINRAEDYNDMISSNKNLLFLNSPAVDVLKTIPNNQIDYIITDPPHGNRQPYLELSLMWNSWLKFSNINYEDEIVISESKDRQKDINNFYLLFKQTLSEMHRILKPSRYLSLMFNSIDDNTWIYLLESMYEMNFTLSKIDTLTYSAGSVVQDTRKRGLKTDFILTFKKETTITNRKLDVVSLSDNFEIKNMIDEYLNTVKDPQVYQIMNYVILELLKDNKFVKMTKFFKYLDLITKQ